MVREHGEKDSLSALTLHSVFDLSEHDNKRPVSISCNGETLRKLRKNRGWTQNDLAKASGYSSRLIRKAESGEPINLDTISILAETLATEVHEVHTDDLLASAGHLVQAFLDRFMQYGPAVVDHVSDIMHEDLRIWVAGDPQRIPFAGDWIGLEGLAQYFGAVASRMRPTDYDPESKVFYVDGANVMFGGVTYWQALGSDTVRGIWQMNHYFISQGRIAEWRNYCDTAGCELLMGDFDPGAGA